MNQQPETDPRKIAKIYKSQLPSQEEQGRKADKLRKLQEKGKLDRGIKGSILDG